MKEKLTDRAQVGIGTLIVFIALVLVAAIAAGVLINTAGLLQSQGQATGQESTDQVSSTLQFVNVNGTAVDSSTVSDVNVTVTIGSGAQSVNLANAQIEIFGDQSASSSSVDQLIVSSTSQDVTSTDPVIRGQSEYAVIDLSGGDGSRTNLLNNGPPGELQAGQEIEIVITTGDGAQTTEIINVPDPVDTGADGNAIVDL
jgi:flagellin-like protein